MYTVLEWASWKAGSIPSRNQRDHDGGSVWHEYLLLFLNFSTELRDFDVSRGHLLYNGTAPELGNK